MRYMDEMRGSEGERCLVIDVLRDDLLIPATVMTIAEAAKMVRVRYDDGTEKIVSYKLVQLEGEEVAS